MADFPESKVLDRAHFRLGEYAVAANDLKTAAAEYRLVVEKWPDSPLVPAALHGLGWALFDQNDFAEAEEAFNTLVEKYPSNNLVSAATTPAGMARHQLGKFAEAIDDLQAVLAAGGVDAGREVRRPLCAGPLPGRLEAARPRRPPRSSPCSRKIPSTPRPTRCFTSWPGP